MLRPFRSGLGKTEPKIGGVNPRRQLVVLILLNLSLLSACKWFAHKPPGEPERREALARFKILIEGVGGSQVWVKVSRHPGAFPLARRDTPIEVLALPATFDRVVSAAQREPRSWGFETQVKERQAGDGRRAVEVRLTSRGALIGLWRIREAARLRRAAIVIDDLGQERVPARKLLELPYPLTFSVLPHLRYSAETAREAYRAGREVMLHLPMEAEPGSPVSPGPGEIKVGMPSDQVARVIEQDLASVPYSAGVNNHMGSRATAHAALMGEVMKVLAEHHLYFVDSRTTRATVALVLARREALPSFYRSVFLDDTETVEYTLGQLQKFRRIADEQGAALAIGHPHPTTLAALAEFLPEFDRADIQLVLVSELIRLPEVARISPPRAGKRERMANRE